MTSAFLLARFVLGLLASFPARPAVFVGLAFLAVARFVFGCGTSGADAFFSDSVVVHVVSPDRTAVVTIHHAGRRKHQGNS
jgi:hypothetical protein